MTNNEGLTVLSCLVLKVHGCIATITNKSADCALVVVNSGMDQQWEGHGLGDWKKKTLFG